MSDRRPDGRVRQALPAPFGRTRLRRISRIIRTLEIVWSVIPLFILIGIFFWGFHGYVVAQIAPANSIEIQVTAKKWVWQFEYPDGMRTLNDIHVPVNRPVRLVMSSEDVIHSFFVPAFRVKKDVLPSRYTEVWFHADEAGRAAGFLHRILRQGPLGHAGARFTSTTTRRIRNGWSKATKNENDAAARNSANWFTRIRGCATCHSLDGTRGQGPSWKGIFGADASVCRRHERLWSTRTTSGSRFSSRRSKVVQGYEPVMPTFKGLLRDREMLGVIEYIKSLK